MFLDRLFPRGMRTLSTPIRVVTGIKPYSETPGVLWARNSSSAGVPVDEQEALTLSAVFAACYRLAALQAMLPVGVYEKTDSGRVERPANPVSNVLNVEMNPEQTAYQARFFMHFWKPLFGAACAEIGWDGAGRATRLWPVGPWRVAPEYDERDRLHYKIDSRQIVNTRDMIYVPHVTQDGVTGRGFVHYAVESLGNAIAADRSAGRFYQNDMKPGGLLRHPGNPTDVARKRFREEWQKNHGGIENRGKVGVLWGGWEWIKDAGAISPDDAQLLETRQFSVIEVARWLNVPPHWLAELGRATWNNIEFQSIETLTQVLTPLFVAFEQEVDRKLLSPPRLYCKHAVNALLRGDMQARGNFYRLMREIGVYTANDVLGFEDHNGIGPEGDRRFVPVNWQPMDDLATGGANAAVPNPAAPPTPSKQQEPPAGPSPAPKSAPMSPMIGSLLEHLLAMLSRKECNEASRAAKKPREFMAWMDGFYPSFEGMMGDALSPVARASGIDGADKWHADWSSRSREELLVAMECKPEEWPGRIESLLASWANRPIETAVKWIAPLTEKELNHG